MAMYISPQLFGWDLEENGRLESPPTQNLWYTDGPYSPGRLQWLKVMQSNAAVAAKNLEVHVTIGGLTYSTHFSANSGTYYYIYLNGDWSETTTSLDTGLTASATAYMAQMYAEAEFQSIEVNVRITSALGAIQELTVYTMASVWRII